MLKPLPWHEPQWQQYLMARQQQRLAHGLLLVGPEGTGLEEFARTLSASLLCFSPQQDFLPCGSCKSCELVEAGSHTDLFIAAPEESGKQIKVETVRELIEFIQLKSQFEHYKVVIINPAEQMNRSSANGLLKTLEEPPPQSLLILISQRPDLLPVTIRSRCQQMRFNPVYDHLAVTWIADRIADRSQDPRTLLQMAGGAPLAALGLVENGLPQHYTELVNDLETLYAHKGDPVNIAEKWSKEGAGQTLYCLLQIFGEMTRICSAAAPSGRYMSETLKCLQRLTNRLDLYRLTQCYDLLLRNYGLSTGQTAFDSRGLLEDFTIYWQSISARTGG